MSQSKAMDRVRRVVDAAMIFGSLLMLAWPVLFEERTGLVVPVAVVVFLGVGVILLAMRWPLLQYAPVAAAVLMAAYRHHRDGMVSSELTGLLIVVSGIILVRQFLGTRTNDSLMRDL